MELMHGSRETSRVEISVYCYTYVNYDILIVHFYIWSIDTAISWMSQYMWQTQHNSRPRHLQGMGRNQWEVNQHVMGTIEH